MRLPGLRAPQDQSRAAAQAWSGRGQRPDRTVDARTRHPWRDQAEDDDHDPPGSVVAACAESRQATVPGWTTQQVVGNRTSPTSRHGPGSSSPRPSLTCSPARSSAGAPPPISLRNCRTPATSAQATATTPRLPPSTTTRTRSRKRAPSLGAGRFKIRSMASGRLALRTRLSRLPSAAARPIHDLTASTRSDHAS